MTTATEHHKQGQGSVARCKSSEAHDAWNVPEFIPLEPSAGPLTIGRASQADIFIRSSKHPSMVSRVHASLWFNESTSQWNITDLEVCTFTHKLCMLLTAIIILTIYPQM
ncbi:hypothetical protein GBAR_LOCUS30309 [Geodia barretti]|uniref:FHA domain-containing protein n=1 Tax=Geodia barretti TaxID=519541 RepID=A0AA35XE71_GEOBA|nr:hypothetical protein GBAR_LOCUS30309 [Geodia barretti]